VNTLRLGSRGSQLALFQARLVAERIQSAGGPACDIVVIKTSGDRLQEAPLSEIGGKRLFVKEIEDALISHDIDLAVHSSKDMPAVLPDGLEVGAVLEREDPRDALVLGVLGSDPRTGTGVRPQGVHVTVQSVAARVGSGRIGTGSVRRIAQLRQRFPTAEFSTVRGNLDTRLRKLDSGDYDLLVLAAAGLRRLGFGARISVSLAIEECVPAPGQGIIAVEIRADDAATREAVAPVNNPQASCALAAERALVTTLGGGCQMPIGGIAVPTGAHGLELHAVVASLDGTRIIRYKKVGTRTDGAALGQDVAEELLKQGAADVLNEARQNESRLPDPESLRLT
jgi:hydroxymethylbilane synthase